MTKRQNRTQKNRKKVIFSLLDMRIYVKYRAVREDEISVKKSESVTILSSNLSRGYLVHRPLTAQVPSQVLSLPCGRHLVHHRVQKLQMMEVS